MRTKVIHNSYHLALGMHGPITRGRQAINKF